MNRRDGYGTSASRSIYKGDRARRTATDRDGTGAIWDHSGIQHNSGEPVKRGGEQMRLASAGSTVHVSFGVDVEGGDSAFVMRDRRGHSRQTRRESNHRIITDKLLGEFVQ